ncbi:MAG: hypothetical protein JSR83_04075 [Proteobacteria bacterium]|nr:hypothetical protein [Pseudomonadota bacterium]
MKLSPAKCFSFGMAGALAPDIALLYSKRFTMPGLHFEWQQYLLATTLYVILGGIVAMIFPHRGGATPWKAFSVGVALPVVLSALASTQRPEIISPRGSTIPAAFIDVISMF